MCCWFEQDEDARLVVISSVDLDAGVLRLQSAKVGNGETLQAIQPILSIPIHDRQDLTLFSWLWTHGMQYVNEAEADVYSVDRVLDLFLRGESDEVRGPTSSHHLCLV